MKKELKNKNGFTISELIVGIVLLAVVLTIVILKYSTDYSYIKNLNNLKKAKNEVVYYTDLIQEQHPYWKDTKGDMNKVAIYYQNILPKKDEYNFYIDLTKNYCNKNDLPVSIKLKDTPKTYDSLRLCVDKKGEIKEHTPCTIDDFEQTKGKMCQPIKGENYGK